MKIGYVSPFPPTPHGVGTYTHYLCRALSKIGSELTFVIVGDRQTTRITTRDLVVVPCFDLDEALGRDEKPAYVEGIVRIVSEWSPDIVHIQHGYSIFRPDDRFLDLLDQLGRQTKLVVTLHAVFANGMSGWPDPTVSAEEYNCRTSLLVDALIVHQASMKQALTEQGADPHRIHVIPHGTELLKSTNKIEARRRLGLPESGHIILSFGFLGAQKNQELLISALPMVLKEVPDAYVFFSGHVRTWSQQDVEKRRLFEKKSQELGVGRRVIFAERYIPDDDINLIFSAVDVAAFPYSEEYLSASGALHLAIGAFKPIVVSRTPKFEEAWTEISEEIAFDSGNPRELADVLIRVLVDDEFTESLGEKVRNYALASSWDVIGRDHLRLYDSLARSDRCRNRPQEDDRCPVDIPGALTSVSAPGLPRATV